MFPETAPSEEGDIWELIFLLQIYLTKPPSLKKSLTGGRVIKVNENASEERLAPKPFSYQTKAPFMQTPATGSPVSKD